LPSNITHLQEKGVTLENSVLALVRETENVLEYVPGNIGKLLKLEGNKHAVI
jgi:hypothetical protein